ncbi:MAG: hypothetical protein KF795_01760 [Labilithrix sp.]|nr:hypothetical protein [Labilithrix sp.]
MRARAFVIGVVAVFAAAFLACSDDAESPNDVTADDAGTVDGAMGNDGSSPDDAATGDADAQADADSDADAASSRVIFGNPSITTEGNPSGQPFANGYLLGHSIVTTSSFTLTRLAVNALDPGPSVVLALYADSAGAPGALVTSTATATLVSGRNELPVTSPVVLPAGTYWIAATYSADAKIANGNDNATMTAFTAHTFGDPLPDPFLATTQTSDQIGLYLVGTP